MTRAKCPFAHGIDAFVRESLAARLKESTKDLHQQAEFHPLQQSIVRGEISRADYARFANAMRQIHEAMEAAMAKLAKSDARVRRLFHDHHRRLHHFDADLALLGSVGSAEQIECSIDATELLGATRFADPLAWLGVFYVLEGSSNGGQAIARVLRRAWDLPAVSLRSLDPHGSATRERWQEFRAGLDACEFSPSERESIIAGASATFRGIVLLMDNYVEATAASMS